MVGRFDLNVCNYVFNSVFFIYLCIYIFFIYICISVLFYKPTPLRPALECEMTDEGHSLTFSLHFPSRRFNLAEDLSTLETIFPSFKFRYFNMSLLNDKL